MNCPCGLPQVYEKCCGLYHSNIGSAPNPQLLMRSRYTAFCISNIDYLLETTDPQVRSEFDAIGTEEWVNTVEFEKLEIIKETTEGNKAFVEFKAYYKIKNTSEKHIHHENSKFRKQNGIWYFREGKVFATK